MIDGKPGFRAILRINMLFILSCFTFGYGWVFWQWASPINWGAGLIAIITGTAGITTLIRAIGEVIGLILHGRKVRRYQAQGRVTRSDPMASEPDLKKRGMTR
jgi:hypothetical protein